MFWNLNHEGTSAASNKGGWDIVVTEIEGKLSVEIIKQER